MIDILVFVVAFCFSIGVIGLINAVKTYKDECRQEKIQIAWDSYSQGMSLDEKLDNVVPFSRAFQIQNGWKDIYIPLIAIKDLEEE